MTGTHWLVIGVVAVAFAVYWFKFRKKHGMSLMHTKTGPQVVKKSGKKSWRSRLKGAALKVGMSAADSATGGAASRGLATAGSLGLT